tara:strand:- start:1022 stop:1372 length:351 start_codon:yes stop_codon:yes gene_type:complete
MNLLKHLHLEKSVFVFGVTAITIQLLFLAYYIFQQPRTINPEWFAVAIEKSDYALLATMVISKIFGLLLIVYSLFNKGKYNLNSRFWVHGTILIIIAGSMTFIWFGFIYLLFKNPI